MEALSDPDKVTDFASRVHTLIKDAKGDDEVRGHHVPPRNLAPFLGPQRHAIQSRECPCHNDAPDVFLVHCMPLLH